MGVRLFLQSFPRLLRKMGHYQCRTSSLGIETLLDSPKCDLVCRTSSLLFALQYGLHRARNGNPDGYEPEQITLVIIDTGDLPNGVFVKDLELINAFSDYLDRTVKKNLRYLQQLREGPRGYYYGKYLSQGRLDIDGICFQSTMQDLINSSLFRLMPEFADRDSWDLWANRLLQLRVPFGAPRNVNLSGYADVRSAIIVAESCFPGRGAVLIAIMLLALKTRRNEDPVILKAFASLYSGR